MPRPLTVLAALIAAVPLAALAAAPPAEQGDKPEKAEKSDKADKADGDAVPRHLKDEAVRSTGTLTVGGKSFGYAAEAGILVVRLKDPMDGDPPAAGEKP